MHRNPLMPNQPQQPAQLSPEQKEALMWRRHQIRDIYQKRFGFINEWDRQLSFDTNAPLTQAEINRLKEIEAQGAAKTQRPPMLALGVAGLLELQPGIYRIGYNHKGDKDLGKFNLFVEEGFVRPMPYSFDSTTRKKGFSEAMDLLALNGHDTLVVRLGQGIHGHELRFINDHKKDLFRMLKLAERKGLALDLTEPNTRYVLSKLSKKDQDRISYIATQLEQNVAAQRLMSDAGNVPALESMTKKLDANSKKDYQDDNKAFDTATAEKKPDVLKSQLDDLSKRLQETSSVRNSVQKMLTAQENILANPENASPKRIETLHKRGFWKALRENLAYKTEADRLKIYAHNRTPEGSVMRIDEVRKESQQLQGSLLVSDLKEIQAVEKRLQELTVQVNGLPGGQKKTDLENQMKTLTESLNKSKIERGMEVPNQSPAKPDPLKVLNENIGTKLNDKKQQFAQRQNPAP